MVKTKELFSGQSRMPKSPSSRCLAWPVLTNESSHGSALLFPTQLSSISPKLFFAREAAAPHSLPSALAFPHTELYLHRQADIGTSTREILWGRLMDLSSE